MSRMLRDIPNWNTDRKAREKARAGDKQDARREIRENIPENLTKAPKVL